MKVGIDVSPVQSSPAGIGQYTVSLITNLLKLGGTNEYYVYSTTPLSFSHAQNIVIPFPKILPLKGLRWMRKVASDAKHRGISVFISPSNHMFTSFFPRTIQFVHDLAPVKYPQFFPRKASRIYNFTTKSALHQSYKIVTISQTIKAELEQFARIDPDKIKVIYPALNAWITAPVDDSLEVMEKYHLPQEYLLCVATLEPRKNLVNLIKGFAAYRQEHNDELKLVLVGKKGWYFESIFKTVAELGLQEDVLFLGYVPNEDLPVLYQRAKGFAYLSIYEGFGMPPLEALYFNVPTLVSDIPLFHECFGDLVSYTQPTDTKAIGRAIAGLLTEAKRETQSEVLAKYSWQHSAAQLLTLLKP